MKKLFLVTKGIIVIYIFTQVFAYASKNDSLLSSFNNLETFNSNVYKYDDGEIAFNSQYDTFSLAGALPKETFINAERLSSIQYDELIPINENNTNQEKQIENYELFAKNAKYEGIIIDFDKPIAGSSVSGCSTKTISSTISFRNNVEYVSNVSSKYNLTKQKAEKLLILNNSDLAEEVELVSNSPVWSIPLGKCGSIVGYTMYQLYTFEIWESDFLFDDYLGHIALKVSAGVYWSRVYI